jgi:type IV pilus assembly protein PilQ
MKRLVRRGSCGLIAAATLAVLALTGIAAAQQADATASDAAAEEPSLNVTSEGIIKEWHLLGTDIRLALRVLGEQSRKNIVATKDVKGEVTADLYNVTFREALDAIVKSAGYTYAEESGFIYVMTQEQLDAGEASQRKLRTEVFRLAYIKSKDAEALIKPALSAAGEVTFSPEAGQGIETSKTDAGGDSYAADDVLIVRDYPENLREVGRLIEELDVKPSQVLIESTILRATLTENNSLGVDFNALAGIDFRGLDSSSSGLESVDTGTISGEDMPGYAASTFRTDFNSAIPAGGMTIGFIANNTAFFIRALEGVTDVTVLANPKLLVMNKHRGEVMVGNRDGYLTTTVTETTATQTVQFLETGTRLVVRPYIGRDGYVRLELHPEDSSGEVEQVGTSVLPKETTTEVTSNVLVRDGHTIVIGGLFRERTSNGQSQVPVLGNIPYMGTVFRRTVDETNREEVIILVTPRIVQQAIDEAVSEAIKQDVDRFRVGQRKGLRWWGSERLAQQYVRAAKRALEDGKSGEALWNVDMALSMEPRMLSAIRMKEQLTERAYWSDENQYSSARFILQRMIMSELDRPYEEIIPPERPLDEKQIPEDVREKMGIEPLPTQPLPTPPVGMPPAEEPGEQQSMRTEPVEPPADEDEQVKSPSRTADETPGSDQPAATEAASADNAVESAATES